MACHSRTALAQRVALRRGRPAAAPYEPALQAIREADLIVLGPGSLFTSIIPNLLVPGVVDAIRASRGRVLFVCSLADVQGETWGLTAREHVEALMDHGMGGSSTTCWCTRRCLCAPESPATGAFGAITGAELEHASTSDLNDDELIGRVRPVSISYADMLAIQSRGPIVISRNLVDAEQPTWHSPFALRDAFQNVIKLSRARRS